MVLNVEWNLKPYALNEDQIKQKQLRRFVETSMILTITYIHTPA